MSEWMEYEEHPWAAAVSLAVNITEGSKPTEKGILMLANAIIEKNGQEQLMNTEFDKWFETTNQLPNMKDWSFECWKAAMFVKNEAFEKCFIANNKLMESNYKLEAIKGIILAD